MIYTIEKGNHYSNESKVSLTTRDTLIFKVRFNITAEYKCVDPNNQPDINKLYGLSDSWSLHHRNSARFGWRYLDNNIQIFAYCYLNGERVFTYLGTVYKDTNYECKLEITKSNYIFTITPLYNTLLLPSNNEPKSYTYPISRKLTRSPKGLKYRLFPYFGGNETAPNSITIEIDEKTT